MRLISISIGSGRYIIVNSISTRCKKEEGMKYLPLLYRFALGDDFKNCDPILDGAVEG